MDLVNDLSSDVVLAIFLDGTLKQKLGAQDAKSFIASVEAELARISGDGDEPDHGSALAADQSH